MTNYVNVFGGEVTPPSDFGYQATTFAVDTTSFWPYNYAGTGCILAKNNDLTASVAALSLTLPDASQVSTGEDFILKNAGAETFTVKDAGGNVLTTIIAGVAKYFVLTNNSTTTGVYDITTFGTGTSSADAATLAGAGHRVNSTAIDNIAPATLISGPSAYTIGSADNAQTLVITSGTATMALPNPATLYNGYYFFFTNSGSGTITFDPYATVTIDGSLTKNIQPGESCIVATDGLNYYTVGYGRSNTYTWTQLSVDLTGLSSYTVTSIQAANKLWEFSGVPAGNLDITIPSVASVYFVKVASIGGYTATFTTGSGSTVDLTSDQYFILSCDGVNVSLAQTITNASTLNLDDGTVANPVISFLLDPDTGIYRIGANNMGIAAGGTLSASFTTAGINGALGASVPSTVSATSGTFSTTLSATGHTTFEGVTSTGATGTGKLVYDNTPTLVAPVLGVATATSVTVSGVVGTSATDSLIIPTGTTAQRGTSTAGKIRLNSTFATFEGYNGTAWGTIGGGATGAGGDQVFQENQLIVTTNYTLSTGKSAMSVGPIVINSGVVVTIPSGYRWVIL